MKRVYLSDAALLEGLSQNDREAMNELYTRYHSSLVHWIEAKGGLQEDAEDVFQDAVMVLYEKSKDVEFCLSASIGTYLFAVCKRLWLKKVGSKNSPTLPIDDFLEQSEDQDTYEEDVTVFLEKEAHFARMYRALNQLGNPCGELLKAFYIEGKNMQEIASLFNYSNAENAKTQKYKCLNRLKKIFFTAGASKSTITPRESELK